MTDDRHMTAAEAAEFLGISLEYLHQLRHREKGPRCFQPSGPGGKVYYYREDLDAWLRSNPRSTNTD